MGIFGLAAVNYTGDFAADLFRRVSQTLHVISVGPAGWIGAFSCEHRRLCDDELPIVIDKLGNANRDCSNRKFRGRKNNCPKTVAIQLEANMTPMQPSSMPRLQEIAPQ